MKNHFIGIILIITLCCLSQVVSATTGSDEISAYEKGMHFNTDTGADVLINATLPGSPLSMPSYNGEYGQFGQIEIVSREWLSTQSSLPSENEAPQLAISALEPYGGLPSDAHLDGIRTNIGYGKNRTTWEIEETYPESVELSYSRSMNTIPVMGQWDGDAIDIELGNNGKLLYLVKNWRNWTSDREVTIINASQAIERLKHSEVNLLGSKNLEISRIKLIYYGMYPEREEGILEPVWQFAVSRPVTSAEPVPFTQHFYVSAIEGESQFGFADFTASPISGRAPLAVQFQDISKNDRVEMWSWRFGDGNSSGEQNPIYIYESPGKYTVILEALDEDRGSIAVKKGLITVSGSMTPVASFTADPLFGRAPLAVRFNDTSENSPMAWNWEFGDGTTSGEQNLTHTYSVAGKYTVSLTVTNADGTDSRTETDLITVFPATPPVAGFSANVTSGNAPLIVQFTDLSTEDPTSWAWDFGDGYVSTQQNPVHQYDVSGTYTVNLTATNDGGSSTKTLTNYITVANPANPLTLLDQLIVYVNNQNNVPRVFKTLLVAELKDVKRSLNQGHDSEAVLGMKAFKITVRLLKGWPLTSGQAATMQNSADAIIDAIDLPVNQQAIGQTNSLSVDVKGLNLQRGVERPLLLELEGAVFNLDIAKDQAAITHLNLFISSVRAQDGKKIPHEKAVQLIAKAEAIKAII